MAPMMPVDGRAQTHGPNDPMLAPTDGRRCHTREPPSAFRTIARASEQRYDV